MNNIKKTDLELFIEHCKNLDFGVTDMRYYSSVALCAFDAIFSIRSNYEATVRPTIKRFCKLIGVPREAPNPYAIPTVDEQISVSDLARRIEGCDASSLLIKSKIIHEQTLKPIPFSRHKHLLSIWRYSKSLELIPIKT